mgnify:CR=1 FL=1
MYVGDGNHKTDSVIRLERRMYIGLLLIRNYDCEQKHFTRPILLCYYTETRADFGNLVLKFFLPMRTLFNAK